MSEDSLKEIELRLNKLIEAINDLECEVKKDQRNGTWAWKRGYIDDNGVWIRGKWV